MSHPPLTPARNDDTLESKPRTAFARAWRRIGGGSLALSFAMHAGLIILAGLIVFTRPTQPRSIDFLTHGGSAQGVKASDALQRQVAQRKQRALTRNVPRARIAVNRPSALALPDEVAPMPELAGGIGPGGKLGSGLFGEGAAGMGPHSAGPGRSGPFIAALPRLLSARCSSADRLEKLRQSGGRPECEIAVTKSLAWLKSKQNPDGSWGRANKCAMTGLALLCYLGRCETPDSPFYGDNVTKGILYLIEAGKRNEWGFLTDDFKGSAGAYEHGIATYALGEMYALARLGSKSMPGMREAFEQGVALIIQTQNSEGSGKGGWDYYTRNVSEGRWTTGRGDLSVTGWQYQALKAAATTKLKIAGLQPAIDRCVNYLEGSQTKDGGIGSSQRDQAYNQWSLTGTGLLGIQTLGKGAHKSVVANGMKFLRQFIAAEPPDWNTNCNLYSWYYQTQAFFQAGGEDWTLYNEQFLPQLLANQNTDGSWKPGRANWPLADAADPIYRQTLCTLQLEVYYRYLKAVDAHEPSAFDR